MKLTEEQHDELKEAFAVYDLNNDSVLTTRALRTLMRQLGQNPAEAEILEMIKETILTTAATLALMSL